MEVSVNLPTSFGKSLIYQALLLAFNVTCDVSDHIVVVISPLINMIKDHVENLKKFRISAVSLCDYKDGEAKALEEGQFSVVYGTQEAWLNNEHWQKMLSSKIYSSKLRDITVDEAHEINNGKKKKISN